MDEKILAEREKSMDETKIKELVSEKILGNIPDNAIQTVLRRVLFSEDNLIDWQDFYRQMEEQMPELLAGKKLKEQEIVAKIKWDELRDDDKEEPHECDNKPSSFRDLSLDELLYLREHQELLKFKEQ